MWKLLLVLGLLIPSLALAISPRLQKTINEIKQVSNAFGFDFFTALRVAECESGKVHNKFGDKGLAFGLFQFHKLTFNNLKKELDMPALNYKSEFDQIILFVNAVKAGYERLWTCFYK